jgi:hypothetical protein
LENIKKIIFLKKDQELDQVMLTLAQLLEVMQTAAHNPVAGHQEAATAPIHMPAATTKPKTWPTTDTSKPNKLSNFLLTIDSTHCYQTLSKI